VTQIFLNYRTDDERFGVAMLDRELSERFGSGAVFFASKSIELGAAWEPSMFRAVAAADAVLVVMGRRWLSAKDEQGNPRIGDPADFVRREIKQALETGKQVIPVRLDTPRIEPADLPADIRELAGLQDIVVRFRHAKIDIDLLAKRLRQQIPALREVTAPETRPAGKFGSVHARTVGGVWQAEQMTFGDFYAGPPSTN
jgi:TIR domain